MVDLPEFCEKLLEHVAATFPGAVLVLDGHDPDPDCRGIASFGELGARRSPLGVERQIGAHLRRFQVGRDVTAMETLGAPARTSLASCERADRLFSVHAAGDDAATRGRHCRTAWAR